MSKQKADWYKNRPAKKAEPTFEERQAEARLTVATQDRLRHLRLSRNVPIQLDGLFVEKEVEPGVLVLGFRGREPFSGVVGVQLISMKPGAALRSHSISPWIGKYVRVTIEELQ